MITHAVDKTTNLFHFENHSHEVGIGGQREQFLQLEEIPHPLFSNPLEGRTMDRSQEGGGQS